jgi:hypothetical protein
MESAGLTRQSEKKLCKLVSLDELEEGARAQGSDRKAWVMRMVEKYHLRVVSQHG